MKIKPNHSAEGIFNILHKLQKIVNDISAVTPASQYYSESLSTLRYAQRAKTIVNKPTINEVRNLSILYSSSSIAESLCSSIIPQIQHFFDQVMWIQVLKNTVLSQKFKKY